MVDINSAASYKPCKKKQFEVWMCRPPLGTVVVDHLTQSRGSSVLKQAGVSGNIILGDVMRGWKSSGDARFGVVMQAVSSGLVSIVSKPSHLVLCGTEGQFYVSDYSFVRAQYSVFSNNNYVNLDAIPELATKEFNWRRVRANSDYAAKTFACFVPVKQSFVLGNQVVNERGIQHGKGDFIVCSKLPNGQPDLRNRWVVNGLVFSDTYNNTGWQECIMIGRQGVIEMPPSVIKEEIPDAKLENIATQLGKLFSVPCIKKSAKDGKYRFDIPGMSVLIEQSQRQTRVRGSDGYVDTFSGISGEAVTQYLEHSRFFYKFMYLAMLEQLKADNMIENTDYVSDLPDFLKECSLNAHFFALRDIHKALKELNLKLSCITISKDDGDYDSSTLYQFSDEKVLIDTRCYSKYLSMLGFSRVDDDIDPCEAVVDWKVAKSGYPGFKTEFIKMYSELAGDDKADVSNDYLDKLRELGIAEQDVRNLSKYFVVDAKSKLALQRGYYVVSWAHRFGKFEIVRSTKDTIWFYVARDGVSYMVNASVDGLTIDGEYNISLRDGSASACVVYSTYATFERSLLNLTKKKPSQSSFLSITRDRYFFCLAQGVVGLASRDDNIMVYTDIGSVADAMEELWCLNTVFSTLYSSKDVPVYTEGTEQYQKFMERAKHVSVDEFAGKMFSVLDRVATKAGYNIRRLPYWRDAMKVATHRMGEARFELVEANPVTGHVRGYVYSPLLDVKIPFSCSATTWKALEAWHGSIPGRAIPGSFSKLHYHQLQLRAGNYMHLYEFKKLRLAFLRENERVFNNALSKFYTVGSCNYNITFRDDSNYSAVHMCGEYIILINATHFVLQNSKISDTLRCTLIHEMCHGFVDVTYGTSIENPGEDGHTVYGISEKYGEQVNMHGKHFGEAVELASKNSGIPFADIFSYGYGHPCLRYNNYRSDRDVQSTSISSAMDNGKSYRDYRAKQQGIFMCKTCGAVFNKETTCHNAPAVVIGEGCFVTRCKSCGDVHVYSNVLDLPVDTGVGYYSDIDVVGLLSTQKCRKCGGSLTALAPGLDTKEYLADFNYTNRYKEHFHSVASGTLGKYNKWFKRVAGCEVSVSCDIMPCVVFAIRGESFEEYYKLFFSCRTKGLISGALYRDYGGNAKGYRIHKFRLRSDTDIVKFMDYFMSYVRRDFKTT